MVFLLNNVKELDSFGVNSNRHIFQLLLKDNLVLTIDLSSGNVTDVNEKLLPFGMQVTAGAASLDKFLSNVTEFNEWCASRVLTLDRKYAKKIYNALGIMQNASLTEKAKISRSYCCVSLQDCYWVKNIASCKKWEDVNLFHNSLSNALVPVALRGETMTLRNREMNRMPDVSTGGTYAKAWERIDEKLVLFKPDDTENSFEVEREVMASSVLDCFNVKHVRYEKIMHAGLKVSACECMTSEDRSIVFFSDIKKYCNRNGIRAIDYIKSIDSEGYYKMIIATYLIGNVDLHDGNWGMFFCPITRKAERIFDMFDFNNAFDVNDYFNLDGGRCLPTTVCIDTETGEEIVDISLLDNIDFEFVSTQSMREAAEEAVNFCNFKQIKPISSDVFINDDYLKAFMERCRTIELNIALA